MNRRELSGMAARAISLIAATSLASTVHSQQSAASTSANQSEYLFWLSERDRATAREMASLLSAELDATPLDAGRISGVYQRGAPALRARSTEATFVRRLMKWREGLGPLRERVLQGVEGGFKFLPNHPDGQYCIVTFDSMFGARPEIYTEQFTLGREPSQGAEWQFIDYYLATRPFYTY